MATAGVNIPVEVHTEPQECLTCRIVGTGALAGVGMYALQASRPRAPGSVIGKRITAGVGVGFLVASVFRWMK
ncbi:hypothetical protein BC835DRAFT_1335945 [Cytidiella melzeri]|nr:hypothetical protein BC835DRAFT_1335945 [Cytidiella melzeri]